MAEARGKAPVGIRGELPAGFPVDALLVVLKVRRITLQPAQAHRYVTDGYARFIHR